MIVERVFKKKKALSAILMKISKNASNVSENLKFIVCIHAQFVQMFNFAPNAMERGEIIIN